MEKNEIFAEYINGSLPAAAENKLFASMSFDEELRNDFRRYIVIDKKLKENAMSYLPPAEVTNAIFAGAGMTFGGNKDDSGFFRKFLNRSKILLILLTFIFTFLLSFSLFTLLNDNNEIYRAHLQDSGSFTGIKQNLPDKTETSGLDKNNLSDTLVHYPVSGSYAAAVTLKDSIKPSRLGSASFSGIARNPVFLNHDTLSDVNAVSRDESSGIEPANTLIAQSYNHDLSKIRSESYQRNIARNGPLNANGFAFNDAYGLLEGLFIEVRNSANWNLKKATISPAEIPLFPNMDLAILYELSDIVQIGAEARQESLFLNYNGTDSLGQYYTIEQNPFLTSFGLFIRLAPYEFLGFSPLLQAGFSANGYGIINRMGAGTLYRLTDNIGLNIMAVYSGFWYSHKHSTHYNDKISLHYGINFRF